MDTLRDGFTKIQWHYEKLGGSATNEVRLIII